MKSSEYWQKRSEEVAKLQYSKTDEYIEKLKREYDKSIKGIEEAISIFYQRYATNSEISMAEARKLLTGKELNEFKMSLEEFIEKAKGNADGRWTQQLNSVYYKTRISRLDALQIQMRQQVEMLSAGEQRDVGRVLSDVYEDTYYRTVYEIQKGTGIGVSFAKADPEKALVTKWVGNNYSGRIWSNRDKLAMELETKLTQSIIRGDSIDRSARDLAERMNVSYSNAARVVRTESSYVANQATADGYKASGIVQEYEYLTTLDSRTSDVCQDMDGKVFKLSEKNVGINYPPLHANCRSTVVPYFGDEEPGKRIARDKDGKTYYVSGDVSYDNWYKKYVIDKYGQEQADIIKKKISNEASDRKQYERYKEVLGKDAPKSFATFQNLKYTDIEGWNIIKSDYRKLNTYEKIVSNEPRITNDLKDIAKATGVQMVGLEYRLKSKESYLRKVNSDSRNSMDSRIIDDTIANTNDVIRYTYQADKDKLVDSYYAVINRMEAKGYSRVKVKNFWNDKRNPYNGVNANYVSSDGQRFEVQFHTPESFNLKNSELHKLYEEYRLDNTTSERKSELTKEMFILSSKLIKPKGIETIK
ncbi:MAG: minor capsid protein [Vulcanibacillus sp.]